MITLLTLLDDIAATLDDVAVMSKVAIKKTSALMSDDLAVNAGVITGVDPSRELPIVAKIFWGSLINKIIAIAGVLILEVIYAPSISWMLLAGGLYLCYEGSHKVFEKIQAFIKQEKLATKKSPDTPELKKIQGAIRTDLILSIEIIVIAKNSLSGDFYTQMLALTLVGLLASIIIYGLVAFIVKIDDIGLSLIKRDFKRIGALLVQSMPHIMRSLGIIGTIAMFLVGGGIIMHTFHWPYMTIELVDNFTVGFVAGILALVFVNISIKLVKLNSPH